jgi:hypothetical protein
MIHDAMLQARFMNRLSLTGTEGKNLVPVDWVSAVMVFVLQNPALQGETYHLTPRERTSVEFVGEVFEAALREYAQIPADAEGPAIQLPASERESAENMFREQMRTYDSHWRDDPFFDATNTLRAAPHLPCPLADRDLLMRTVRYAVEGNFGWPRPRPVEIGFDVNNCVQFLLDADERGAAAAPTDRQAVGLQVTGKGGGDYTILLDGESPVAARLGVANGCIANYFLNSAVFQALVQDEISVEQAIYSGAVVVDGDDLANHRPLNILRNVVAVRMA